MDFRTYNAIIFEGNVPQLGLVRFTVMSNIENKITEDQIQEILNGIPATVKPVALFPIIVDSLEKLNMKSELRLSGGMFNIKTHLTKLGLKLMASQYKKWGRDRYIEVYGS